MPASRQRSRVPGIASAVTPRMTGCLPAAARERKVAYVPGRPFYPGDAGATQIRLAYSRVADHLIDEGIRRIGDVLKTALEGQ